VKRLEEAIAYYMKGLEPGGRYTKTRFTQEQAEKTLDKLTDELSGFDPRRRRTDGTLIHNGKTFREAWESGGIEVMAEDLRRVGITCEVTRTKAKGVRAPSVHLRLKIPRDVTRKARHSRATTSQRSSDGKDRRGSARQPSLPRAIRDDFDLCQPHRAASSCPVVCRPPLDHQTLRPLVHPHSG